MCAIDLLSHHGGSKTVLLHRSTDTRKALAKWVTEIGRALLENVEIRLVAMSTFGANSSSKASLDVKSVITDTYTVLGSYNLSRAGNFEVIATQQESITTFDEMWDNDLVLTNQAERIYNELYYAAPEGSKRKARYDAINAQVSARKRASKATTQSQAS